MKSKRTFNQPHLVRFLILMAVGIYWCSTPFLANHGALDIVVRISLGLFWLAMAIGIYSKRVSSFMETIFANRRLQLLWTWLIGVALTLGGAYMFLYRNRLNLFGDPGNAALNTFWGPVICMAGLVIIFALLTGRLHLPQSSRR